MAVSQDRVITLIEVLVSKMELHLKTLEEVVTRQQDQLRALHERIKLIEEDLTSVLRISTLQLSYFTKKAQ